MKGRAVSVELTGLKKAVDNYENFAHCWMDGDIVSHDEKKGTVMIRLRQRVGKVFTLPADSEHIQNAREETLKYYWQKGDEVHVRETNGGKVGWWAATIVSEPKFGDTECTVRWKGAYQHDNESKVKVADLRLAREPVENNEKQEASEEAQESAEEKDDREHDDEADESDGEDDNDADDDNDKKKSSVKRERPSNKKKNKKKSESATDVKKGKKS